MIWYERLNDYFPEEEMKKQEHLKDLVEENPYYKKEEEGTYLVLYAEFENFIFVDYILVDKRYRGEGIGSSILDKLKKKGKTIILEVEPMDRKEPDTIKRQKFYKMNEFENVDEIDYYRDVGEKKEELFEMQLFVYSPTKKMDVKEIRWQTIKAYREIHHYKYEKYFDREKPKEEQMVRYEEE